MNPPIQILVVDDDESVLAMVKEEVISLGYQVVTARNGIEALEALEKSTPDAPIDAIVSDLTMPKMTGLDLLAKLRGQGSLVPLIILSGYADKEKAITAVRLGVSDIIEKPFELKQFQAAVKRVAALGLSLRTLEAEIEALGKAAQIPAAEFETFRERQRAVLLLHKEMRSKKAA